MKSVSGTPGDEKPAAATVHVQLLGAFRVTVGARTIAEEVWRLRKAAGLIKLLALAPGNSLHKEQLFDALWPEMAPQAADNNLRRTLHGARRTLEPGEKGSTHLIWHGERLQLTSAAGVVVDVDEFERAAAMARRSGKLPDYRTALALYGGELLPTDRYADWVIARRESLQRLHLSLVLEMARIHEGRQESEQAIAAYRQVAEIDPLQEEACAALMRLHALTGRRGQALQQYRQLANALEHELGVSPDPATKRLHDEIRAGRFPGPHERVLPQAPQATKPPLSNLPYALTSFVGREAEMAAVKRSLTSVRLLTLTGAGGSGKTRLALEVGHALLDHYADGVWLVQLASLAEPELLSETVGRALGLTEQPGRATEDALIRHLQARHLLLLLDNCEHLSEAVAQLVDKLLRSAPRLTVLTTSRHALEILGEALFPVPPLSQPDERAAHRDPLAFEAIRLFFERAQLVRQEFTLTSANSATVVQLCRRLDGLPLAIELAAARLNALTLDAVAAGLDDRFTLLTRGNRTALPRQQTLRAVMDWSYALLGKGEQKLFRRLGVFSGSASLEAVESVCNRDGDLPFGVREGVAALGDKSLLQQSEGPDGRRRITMLETVHAYAHQQLTDVGEVERLTRTHGRYYLSLAETAQAELSGPRQALWLEQLDADHDNLRAALRWAEAQDDVDMGLRMAAALWRFWLTRSYFGEGRDWCARVLARGQATGDPALVATVLKGAGALSYRQGDFAEARTLFEQGLATARRTGDRQNVADLLNNLGLVAQAQGRFAQARDLYAQCLEMTRALGDRSGAARTLGNLGLAALYQGDYVAARSLLSESLSIARDVGNKSTEDNTLNNLGVLAIYEEAYDEARALNEERLALARELGNKMGIASALHNLGYVASCEGDDAAAETLYQESLQLAGEMGDKGTTAAALQNLAGITARRGDADRARSLYRQSLAMVTEIGDRLLMARILEQTALLAATQRAPVQAARLGGAAEALREAIHAPQPPAERTTYQQEMAAARALVDEETWRAAWEQGRLMPPEEALAELA